MLCKKLAYDLDLWQKSQTGKLLEKPGKKVSISMKQSEFSRQTDISGWSSVL